MIIFMDLVLHTPPSWLSMPSMVPLDVAAAETEWGGHTWNTSSSSISEKQTHPKDNTASEGDMTPP